MRRAPTRSKTLALLFLLAGSALACDTDPVVQHGSAIDRGRALFHGEMPASPSKLNLFACATCHSAQPPVSQATSALMPGVPLAGAHLRPSFWNGQEADLLAAMNHCRSYFMRAQKPWLASDADAQGLYAWIESLPPTLPEPVTMTFVAAIADLAKGDATVGKQVYDRACKSCHGNGFSGDGRLGHHVPELPEETLAMHPTYTPTERRLVFVEKVRHGTFFGYGGAMPPFAREVLSDAQLADVLAYLALY